MLLARPIKPLELLLVGLPKNATVSDITMKLPDAVKTELIVDQYRK